MFILRPPRLMGKNRLKSSHSKRSIRLPVRLADFTDFDSAIGGAGLPGTESERARQ